MVELPGLERLNYVTKYGYEILFETAAPELFLRLSTSLSAFTLTPSVSFIVSDRGNLKIFRCAVNISLSQEIYGSGAEIIDSYLVVSHREFYSAKIAAHREQ